MAVTVNKPVIPEPGSCTWPFRLGDRVKDKINGLEGIAISRFFHATGCDRFGIELDAKEGKPGDIYHCDGNRLELVAAHPERHREEVRDFGVRLGDKATSALMKIVGYVHVIHVPLYGAVQVDITPEWDPKEKKLPEGYFVDAHFVTVLEPYTPTPPKKAAAPKKTDERGCSRMSGNWTQR